jgi:hypothetical protein
VDHTHEPPAVDDMTFQAAFTASGRSGEAIDTVTLLFGCMVEDCPVKLEHVVDIAATLSIFKAHKTSHPKSRDAAKLAELFGPDGQPIAAKPGLLDT